METLKNFVRRMRNMPVPFSIVTDSKIVDGTTLKEWTVEELTAEAFNQDILDSDEVNFEDAKKLIAQELDVA